MRNAKDINSRACLDFYLRNLLPPGVLRIPSFMVLCHNGFSAFFGSFVRLFSLPTNVFLFNLVSFLVFVYRYRCSLLSGCREGRWWTSWSWQNSSFKIIHSCIILFSRFYIHLQHNSFIIFNMEYYDEVLCIILTQRSWMNVTILKCKIQYL